jgi:hypothetical protein
VTAALVALALSVEPSLMRRGSDERAMLRVEAAETPVVTASIGKIHRLRPAGNGIWEAQYVPPDDGIPQVALLTVVAGGEVAWKAIPLWAEGDAVVKTRPRGRISVNIGGRTFGPVVADARGRAVVPVVVPPGVYEALHGKRRIPLHVPASRTIHVAIGKAAPTADRAQTVSIYVIAVNAQGTPRSGAALKMRSTRGELSPVRERAPGLYETSLSLAPGAPGKVRVSASLVDAPAFVAEAVLLLGGGPAANIGISSDRERIAADDPHARLHVTARDAAGNAPGEELSFQSTAGQVIAAPVGPGEWDLTLSLDSRFAGRTSVEVRVLGSARSAARTLPLIPGPLESISFDPDNANVLADGVGPLRLAVHFTDRYGNPVSAVHSESSVGQGRAELEDRGGVIYASYVPPLLREPAETELSVRAGPTVGRAHLTLVPKLTSVALSAKAGLLSNFSGFTTPLIGVVAALRTDRFGPQLAFGIEVDYAHRSESDTVATGGTSVPADSALDLVLLHLHGAWRRQLGPDDAFWIGAGPSLAAYWTRVRAPDVGTRRGFAVAPGLHATIGAEHRFDRWVPFLEARAGWITSPELPILTGPLRTLSLFAGVRLETH